MLDVVTPLNTYFDILNILKSYGVNYLFVLSFEIKKTSTKRWKRTTSEYSRIYQSECQHMTTV